MGFWVSGMTAYDLSGWFLLTREQIPIRLRAGLVARFSRPVSQQPSSLPLPERIDLSPGEMEKGP
jgi:hypothetical protein